MASRKGDRIDAFVGARIAIRRTALGISQSALAERVGVSFQQLQKYESGANRISASRLHRLAVVLGASVSDFFPPATDAAGEGPPQDWGGELRALGASREGRALAEAFPRIADRELRRSVTRIVAALAGAP